MNNNELVKYMIGSVKTYLNHVIQTEQELETYMKDLDERDKHFKMSIVNRRNNVLKKCKEINCNLLKTGDRFIVVSRLVSCILNLYFNLLEDYCKNAVAHHEAVYFYRMQVFEFIYNLENTGYQLLRNVIVEPVNA